MGTKPPTTKRKDLAPKSGNVKGGKLAVNDNWTLVRGAKPAPKDLAPKSGNVKGGGTDGKIALNDNMTLVRVQ